MKYASNAYVTSTLYIVACVVSTHGRSLGRDTDVCTIRHLQITNNIHKKKKKANLQTNIEKFHNVVLACTSYVRARRGEV